MVRQANFQRTLALLPKLSNLKKFIWHADQSLGYSKWFWKEIVRDLLPAVCCELVEF